MLRKLQESMEQCLNAGLIRLLTLSACQQSSQHNELQADAAWSEGECHKGANAPDPWMQPNLFAK